ncbi:RDD family protein [Nocardioides panacis]|uniref:RDD family protein n=1 Tax=Nocardioides panacis TaxID=2849501 RepID=A0A975SVI0_9ACTN|nr:RDD family protein [Nocardioides panacis]QWZ06670.1 RDD family protein [Nocardioides panacis]
MTEMPEGWYTDPAPANPAYPTTMRWWDGRAWTARTRPAKRAEREESQARLHAEQMRRAEAYAEQVALHHQQHGGVGQLQVEAPDVSRYVTPDGQLLAGWGRRLAAYLLDGVLLLALTVLLGWPFVRRVGEAYSTFMTLTLEAARTGTPPPDARAFTDAVAGPIALFGLVALAVGFVYGVGFLKAFSATPGKLLVGIEVRLREAPGPLPWGTVLVRWVGQNGSSFVSLVPLVGPLLGFCYALLDGLWPLWDGRRQALHDKPARTSVVRR